MPTLSDQPLSLLPGSLDPEQFPTFAAMRAVRRWIIADSAKVPHYANGRKRSGALDAAEDVAQFATYEDACNARDQRGDGWHLGFALGRDGHGHWQGIDLDHIQRNGLADLANSAPGYVELSPSGEGIHAIGYGQPFDRLGSNESGVEAYVGGRYFTVTERPIRDGGPVCLASFVAQALVARHGAARASSHPGGAEDTPVDDSTKRDLRSALLSMRADDRQLWVRMGFALRELGGIGRALWMEWSATSDKFDPKDAARKWDGFKPSDTGYQAVFAEARRHGWLNPGSSAAQPGTAAPIPPPSRSISLLVDGDLDALPRLRWLVKSIIPDAGIGAIYGDSGTFKSFLTLDLLAHVSNGREWFGQRVKAAPAVYVPFEGQGGIPNRVRAWRLAQTIQRNPELLMVLEPDQDVRSNIAVVMDPLNLRDAGDCEALVAILKRSGWAGGVLCIDTLAHASNGIEENSSAMGEMIGIFRDLQQRLGGVILLVHHSGKDQTRGMRGWSGLHAAMDFVVECQKEGEGDTREAQFRLSKVKDGTTGTTFKFRMGMIPLGCDEDGEPFTSLVVCPKEESARDAAPPMKGANKAGIRDIDADTSAKDDGFVWSWVAQQVLARNFPSKNSLKGQLPEMKETGYQITQDRVLAAVERLMADKRLAWEKELKSPSGNVWIRPVETTPSSGSLA